MSQDQPEDTAAAVAGLAREVEGLSRAVKELQGLPRRMDELSEMFARLSTAAAAAAAQGASPSVGTPSWLALPAGGSDAEMVLKDLLGWMEQVYLRYADAASSLPECWMWHPDVVEELVWLQHAWLYAYTDAEQFRPHLPGDWHDRQRPGVVRRIKASAGTCSLDNHLPAGTHHHDAVRPPVGEALEQIAAWWAMRRGEAAPAPTPEQLATAAASRSKTRRSRQREVDPDD
ncbi:hypothetical protein [Actinopolymorpha sp. B9G3]|uniref:hypothetical protein n=1 Tax=Actinopolymorpha sp. B9G3 TaxID=3158970 RepID=UPI0032D8CE3A